jgi:hypothetical protein
MIDKWLKAGVLEDSTASRTTDGKDPAMPHPREYFVPLSPELEKKRRIPVKQAAELRGISEEVFRKQFGHLIEQASPRRQVVQLGRVLDE